MNKKEKEYLLQELSNNAFILGNNTRAGLENGNSFASTLGAYHALQQMAVFAGIDAPIDVGKHPAYNRGLTAWAGDKG